MTDLIRAPWTSEQVDTLEQFQTASGMHPFTCGAEHHALAPRLVPSHSGWYCPDPECDYRQDWAHAYMADPSAWRRPIGRDIEPTPESIGPTRWCCNGSAKDCALCTGPYPPYPLVRLCPGHPKTASSERIVSEATQATGVREIRIVVNAPTDENAGQWAETIRDQVFAEYGQEMRLDVTITGGQA